MKKDNPYDERYAAEGFYWPARPSSTCLRLIEILGPVGEPRPTLLDLGCGEGRNAVYLAGHGFAVTGLDVSLPGLEKTRRYAAEKGVEVDTVHADMTEYELTGPYDVIFSTGSLQYLAPEMRECRFEDYKAHTRVGGLNAMSAFVRKPFIDPAPDAEADAYPYRSGELLGYYWDWEIVYSTEETFDCMSSGVPHRHAVSRVIARRVG
ncbi:MAG TPA: tellurite resistance methyltransferase TehB [Armatimonadetes bacterium]|jgi:tellurite methyltransferase|nr:tellurite resistance methyltransferase TehB [Armatimonadota bacterium]